VVRSADTYHDDTLFFPMKFLGRTDDLLLLGGLIVALVVIVSPLLGRALQLIQQVDQGQGLRLLQALVIITSVFGFHQVRKRHEMHAEAAAAAAAAPPSAGRGGSSAAADTGTRGLGDVEDRLTLEAVDDGW
jgi:hypothetical protein